MGSRELWSRVKLTEAFFATHCNTSTTLKMSEAEAQDAFIIFDEAYEGADVDAFYLADILRALGCNVTNAAVIAAGGAEAFGEKLEQDEAAKLCELLGIVADEEDNISYMDFIDKLLAATASVALPDTEKRTT